MKCEKCGKPATTHITEVVNGKKTETFLCSSCAQGGSSLLGSLLYDDFDTFFPSLLQRSTTPTPHILCPKCGNSLDNIRKSGKMGCGECYNTFYTQLLPTLKELHGASRHTGVMPESNGHQTEKTQEIQELKRHLDKAVQDQNFEEAAILRDRIRRLEQ